MKKLLTVFSVSLMFMFAAGTSQAATYQIDPVHSTIGFAVKHLVVSTTRGSFNDCQATITYDKDDLSAFSADVTIDVKSVDTKNKKRDDHLVNADFFDAEKFPQITFKSSTLKDVGGQLTIVGDLTIRGMTKEISIPVEIAGPIASPFGFDAIGITGETTINRQDFGVSWNKALDTGGFVVGDDVRLIVEIEAHSKKEK